MAKKIKENRYHLAVHICIFNKQGEMLIQHRQPFKSGWSDLWDITVGGSAVSGGTSQTAAEREVLEEIGYKLDLSNIRPSFTINFQNGFNDIYLVEREIEIDALKLQYEEVKKRLNGQRLMKSSLCLRAENLFHMIKAL